MKVPVPPSHPEAQPRPGGTPFRTARGRGIVVRNLAGVLLLVLGCQPGGIAAPTATLPEIQSAVVEANPHNVLSAVVTTRTRHADSITILYGVAGQPPATRTPTVPSAAGLIILPVLGLHAETEYVLRVLAHGGGQVVTGEALTFTTGPLPDDLPQYVASGSAPSSGYVAFAAGKYGLVIDNSGRVVWYRHFPGGIGLNFQAQPTGRYVARLPVADPAAPAGWVEIDPLGNLVRQLPCFGGLPSRFHDLLVQPDGSYWILCDETLTMDLSQIGGVPNARVTGTVIQHVSAAGALLFQWSAFDHFALTDLPVASRTGPAVNWTHGNAIDLDFDGHLLVSFRSLNEITKIDAWTGRVIWRMGGLRNQFTFDGGMAPPFVHQHGVRASMPGQLLLLDNLGDPAHSRAERYAYDAATRTAWQVGSFSSLPPVTAQLGGTTQDLPASRLLVSFGSGARVEEYDSAGQVAWRLESPGYVFRAQRIQSLYQPGVGLAR